MQCHRFRDSAGLWAGKGETTYLAAADAIAAGRALIAIGESIMREPFGKSSGLTFETTTHDTGDAPRIERDEDGRAIGATIGAQPAALFIATADSRNFEFEGHGASETEALAALDRAYFIHGQQYDLESDWHVSAGLADREAITVRPVLPGSSFRDGQALEGAEQIRLANVGPGVFLKCSPAGAAAIADCIDIGFDGLEDVTQAARLDVAGAIVTLRESGQRHK